ncbi:MAG: hypothetical protein NTX05_04795 [Fusobacteria bacterium]|nr:hypothetical protein [Fusobacteriota bacterium]
MNKKNGVLIIGVILLVLAGFFNFFKGVAILHSTSVVLTYMGAILIIIGFFIFNRISKK